MVAVISVAIRVVAVLFTSVAVVHLSVDFCHLTTVPVCPERVSVVLLVPEHTVAEPAIVPPTETGSTVIWITFEAAAPVQSLLQLVLTTLLYQVARVSAAGEYPAALEVAISWNPSSALVVEYCHLYSGIPE